MTTAATSGGIFPTSFGSYRNQDPIRSATARPRAALPADQARTHQEPKLRDQDFRHSRRRDLEVDTYHPQPRAFGTRPRFSQPRLEAPSGPPVHGVVKWFSPDKGFGFVELSDGSGDAFLHGSVLAQTGINTVQPGETLEVRVGPGHKGPHITEIISVDRSTAKPTTPRRSNFGATTSNGPSSGTAVEETGTVKWFNAERGYGFIALDGGSTKDVFVHISALERSGLTDLGEGQQVIVDVVEGRKGLEATRVRLV
jgi:cold shock protein